MRLSLSLIVSSRSRISFLWLWMSFSCVWIDSSTRACLSFMRLFSSSMFSCSFTSVCRFFSSTACCAASCCFSSSSARSSASYLILISAISLSPSNSVSTFSASNFTDTFSLYTWISFCVDCSCTIFSS